MELSEQIRKLRRHLDMTGESFGAILGMAKSALSKVERGDRSLNYHQIQALVDRFDIDPRYFFGLIADPTDALASKNGNKPDYRQLVHEIRNLTQKISPSGISQVAYEIAVNGNLREIVSILRVLDGHVLKELKGVIHGYLQGRRAAASSAEVTRGSIVSTRGSPT